MIAQILVTPSAKARLAEEIVRAFDELGDMSERAEYPRIVNEDHFRFVRVTQDSQTLNCFSRLVALLEASESKVIYKATGEINAKEKFIPFHLLEAEEGDEVMKGEVSFPVFFSP